MQPDLRLAIIVWSTFYSVFITSITCGCSILAQRQVRLLCMESEGEDSDPNDSHKRLNQLA